MSRTDAAQRSGLDAAPQLLAALRSAVASPEQVRHRAADRLAFAHDASHYLLTPQAVVAPTGAEEVAKLLEVSASLGVPLTFRSGGTSLSGQGVTGGVLVDTRRHFRSVEILDRGERVRVQPGVTLRQVNARLAPYGRKLGPDPASEAACTVGGVVANNSSGMACGTQHNAYKTIESLVLVLPSGTVLDTAAHDADERLRTLEPDLFYGLARLRERLRSKPESVRTVERLFAMKNTMGYGLNSFLDHTRSIDILAHLIVGSEGTLAFVAEATFRTLPILPCAATGLLVFDDLSAATAALPALVETQPAMVELLDATSLAVAQRDPDADPALQAIVVRQHAALLIEYQESTPEALADRVGSGRALLRELAVTQLPDLTDDAGRRNRFWRVRKGLYAAVAGARPPGTTALLEDVVVPVRGLFETCRQLTGLFRRHGYEDSVIFGHAKDGNIHFMLTQRFDAAQELHRYQRFSDDLVDLVLGQGGSLKAEHGTGRMMAPYVRRQYGDELYAIMCQTKRLCDPRGLLNPGVILDDDPQAHVRNIKVTPEVEPEVDRCVECGYCEPVCPSRDLTTTPRQRIVLRREMALAEARGDRVLLGQLQEAYSYDAVDTCAVDGMCQTACPVLINTGDLVRRLRSQGHGSIQRAAWRTAGKHWEGTTRMAATALDVAAALPAPLATKMTRAARHVLGPENVPLWTAELPRGGYARPKGDTPLGAAPEAVFFTACIGSMFGPTAGGQGAGPAFVELCRRAGVQLVVPTGLPGLCCGTPWKSKGLSSDYAAMGKRALAALRQASRGGTLPIVCDASSCTEGLHELVAGASAGAMAAGEQQDIHVVDAVDFVLRSVLPRLSISRRLPSLALHPTCSSTRLGGNEALHDLASAIAEEVIVPDDWGCCAFAGDRGLLHPELTASATRDEALSLSHRRFTAYASCNRTCEMGLTRATGQEFQHLIELVEQATR